MKSKLVLPVAILSLTAMFVVLLFIHGCARQSDPVSPMPFGIVKYARVVTPGEAEGACLYDDTLYVADNQMGVARIVMSPTPRYVSSYQPNREVTGAFGYIWVAYDSLTHTIIVSDRGTSDNKNNLPSTMNRLLGLFYSPDSANTLKQRQENGYDATNCGSGLIFHDPDTTLHLVKSHLLGHGFILCTLVGREMRGAGGDTVGFKPPTARFTGIRQAVIGKPYVFGAAEEYGLISLYYADWNTSPVEAGHVDLPGYSKCITKMDSFCYVATKWSGIGVVNVADGSNPRLVRMVDAPNSSDQFQIEVSGDKSRLFLVDNLKGIYVFSLRDPSNPQFEGILPHLRAVSICCYRNQLYVCSEAEGVTFYSW